MASFGKKAALAFVVIGLVSCSPVGTGEQPTQAPTTSAEASSPTVNTRTLDLSAAWPHIPTRTWSADVFVEISATPDGTFALGEATGPAPTRQALGPAIMNRATGQIDLLRSFSNRAAQVVSIVGDSDWICWVEGTLQPNFQDWIIYSFDRRTRQVRTLAAAPKPYAMTQYVLLSMSNGTIVWSAIENADNVYHVYGIGADGTGRRVLASNARGPQIVWPWVVYAVKPAANGSPTTIAKQNLESGVIEPIVGPENASYFAFDGKSLAWVSGDTNDLFLQSPLSSPARQIRSGRYLQFVSMNGRLVGWGEEKGAFVFDRKLGAVIQLSALSDFYPVVSSQALDWLFQPNPDAVNPFVGTMYHDVNITDLP